ncbi:unnamed protein product [Candida verbasci]|uniref:Uncharacterized protein n=1 Tax=Candida verbasci TaxID=1227364 RepID=A0A9W4TUA0_9ASCO|nr:unnamed protein product [Candida verbasci]
MAICQFIMGASILVAISRSIWAFSRDNGSPFSFRIKKVNHKLSVPVNAVIFGAISAIIIGLLVLIGSLTFGRSKFRPGKFYLGKILSPLVRWISVLFGAYIVIISQFPAEKAVDKDTMNYTVIVSGFAWVASLTYCMVYARKIYHIDVEDDSEMVIEGVEESYMDIDSKL